METKQLILLLMPLGLQLFGLSFAVLTDRYLQKKQRGDMLLIAGLVLCLIVQNLLESALSQGTQIFGRTLAAIAGFLLCSSYPILQPTTGSMPGIKAFTAAVFGGIGLIIIIGSVVKLLIVAKLAATSETK